MLKLNLPQYSPTLKKKDGKLFIFDPVRKKYLFLTPEEWVRQHFLNYLLAEKKIPSSLVKLEHPIEYNTLGKRADIVVYNRTSTPVLLVECKASTSGINSKVIFQILTYNSRLRTPFLCVTNGLHHIFYKWDIPGEEYISIDDLPEYTQMIVQS